MLQRRMPTQSTRVLTLIRLDGVPMTTVPLPVSAKCPAWCTTEHGVFAGVDDQFHLGAPLVLTNEVIVRLCADVDPQTGAADGPYVIVSSSDSDDEWTLEHTRSTGQALIALATAAHPCE